MNRKKIDGFSLIEIAIFFLVLGLIAVPLIRIYQTQLEREKIIKINGAMGQVSAFLDIFVKNNGRYPVPASLTAVFGDTDYGLEWTGTPTTSCTTTAGVGNEGICITNDAEPVYIGGVPFETLGLHEEDAYDFWGRRLVYVVTASQTNEGTYERNNEENIGKVIINGLDANGVEFPIGTGFDLMILSLGEDGEGAFGKQGFIETPCDATKRQATNCLMDDREFLADKSKVGGVNIGSRSFVNNADYYDDYTLSKTFTSLDNWFDNNETAEHYALTTAERLGLGEAEPEARVHVVGNIKADENVLSDDYCDENGNNCFNPALIGGEVEEMDCANSLILGNQPVLKIGERRVFCATPIDVDGNSVDMNSGAVFSFVNANDINDPDDDTLLYNEVNCGESNMLMSGIDENGVPICVIP